MQVTVKVPATSGNLGPGFDCLGLAFELWNETSFSLTGDGLSIVIQGEGRDVLSMDKNNLIAQAAMHLYQTIEKEFPKNLAIQCQNFIPISSGLGSSATAVLAGLLGANALAGDPLEKEDILQLAIDMEGFPDNVSPALYGGLTLSTSNNETNIIRQLNVHPFNVVIVLPDINLSTQDARDALPKTVSLSDAVFNLSHTALTVEALRAGDLQLLQQAMQDRLHQSYRLPLILGAAEAIQAAQNAGAAAALSGAGPSVIAFSDGNADELAIKMQTTFEDKDVSSKVFKLDIAASGAEVTHL